MTITLRSYQKKGVELSRTRPRFAFFWKPGTGKTILILGIQKERPMRTLVVAKKSIFETAWVKDAKAMGVRCILAWDLNRKRRLEKIRTNEAAPVLVTNYEQFCRHAKDFLDSGVERVVFDESSRLKNRESESAYSAVVFCDNPKIREVYLLSGTPAPNNDTELWSQLRVLTPRAAGRDYWKWVNYWFTAEREKIFKKVPDHHRGGTKLISKTTIKPNSFHVKDDLEEKFYEHVRSWSWYLSREECVDLPGSQDVIRYVPLSPAEKRAYKKCREEMKLVLGSISDELSLEDKLRSVSVRVNSSLMKRRQILGGFLIDDTKTATQIGSSKLESLDDLLEELPRDEPVLIWSQFRHEILAIEELLRKRGEAYDTIDGRTRRPVAEIVNEFQSGKISRVIAHPASAGHGTDGLQKVCAYGLYYSISFSQEEDEQSRDRINRDGQERKCTFYYFIGGSPDSATVDLAMYHSAKAKTSRQEAMLSELKRDF